MRFFPLLVALLFMAGCATSARPVPLTLNWAGLYDTKAVRSSVPGPKLNVRIPNSRLISRQDRVPAQKGILFGLNFTVPGPVIGEEIALRKVIRFPSPGLTTPQGQLREQTDTALAVKAGQPFTTGYRLDEDWEVQEGEWVFEIWRNEQLLLRKSFYVTLKQSAPAKPPELTSVESPRCPQIAYPKNAVRNGAIGETQVLFTVQGDGNVQDVTLLTPSGTTQDHAEMDSAVIHMFKMCHFNPVRGIELYYIAQTVNWVL